MARKPAKDKSEMVATVEEMKVVRLELPMNVHKAFRIAAAEEGVSMAVLARKAVDDLLSKRKGAK